MGLFSSDDDGPYFYGLHDALKNEINKFYRKMFYDHERKQFIHSSLGVKHNEIVEDVFNKISPGIELLIEYHLVQLKDEYIRMYKNLTDVEDLKNKYRGVSFDDNNDSFIS